MATRKFANIPWSTFSFQAKTSQYRSVYCSSIQAKIIDCINTLWNRLRLDKSFATRWFVDHLAKLGFSVSSGEVKLFKESAIASSKEQIDANHHETQEQPPTNQPSNRDDVNANGHETQEQSPTNQPSNQGSVSPQMPLAESDQVSQFGQWAADNVDHNIRTLTGKGTFHGMGIISVCSGQTSKLQAIKHLRHRSQSKLLGSSIPFTEFHGSSFNGLKELKFDSVKATETITVAEMTLDLLWHSAWFFASSKSHVQTGLVS